MSTRMACSTGARPPPPIPCRTRAMSMMPRLGAMPQKNEVMVKSATQAM